MFEGRTCGGRLYADRQSVSVAHAAACTQVHRSAAFNDRIARAKCAEQPGCRHRRSVELYPRVLLGGKGMVAAGRQSGLG